MFQAYHQCIAVEYVFTFRGHIMCVSNLKKFEHCCHESKLIAHRISTITVSSSFEPVLVIYC